MICRISRTFLMATPAIPKPASKIYKSIWGLHEYLTQKCYATPVETIIFIDGDNSSDFLNILKQLGPEDYTLDWIVQVIFVHSLSSSHFSPTASIRNCPWFFQISSTTICKDAADHAISMLAGSLNVSLSKHIQFIFISTDHFTEEVEYQICLGGREATRISRPYSPEKIYTVIYDQPYDVNSIPSKKSTIWESLEDKDLVSHFHKHYHGSLSGFSRQYPCDYSNFSKWLRGRKLSPSSRECVVTFLKEHTKKECDCEEIKEFKDTEEKEERSEERSHNLE